jgi:hypothetical protein
MTATTTGSLSGSEDDVRHLEILTALYGRHPESREILTELDNLSAA